MAKNKQVLALSELNVAQRRSATPLQSRQRQNMAAAGHAWSNLQTDTRATWQALANQMNHETGLRTPAGIKQKRPMSAFQCFSSLNVTLLACGQPISLVAPGSVTKPWPLPPLMLQATSSPSDPKPADKANGTTPTLPFTLVLHAPAYADLLQIYAVPPLLAGQYPESQKSVLIAVPFGLTAGPTDLAPAYNAKFGPLQSGQQVVLTLVPISDEGFKGTPLNIAATVDAPAQTLTHKRGDNLSLKSA